MSGMRIVSAKHRHGKWADGSENRSSKRGLLCGIQDFGKKVFNIFRVCLGGFCEAVKYGRCVCTAGRVAEQPVFPPDHKRTDRIFCAVVAQRDDGVLQKCRQVFLLAQRILDCALKPLSDL